MKTICTLLGFLSVAFAAAPAQAVPAATGPGGPLLNGNLHYAFRYSQTADFGSSLGDWQTSSSSVSLEYAPENQRHPFSANYVGGYSWTLSGPTYSTGLFQHLMLSQAFDWRKWNIRIGDDVSYRPQAPTTGFSGIPGIGEPIGEFGSNPPSNQSILTVNSRVIENAASGELEHEIKNGSYVSAGGGNDLLRYPDGSGLDTNTQMANAGLAWRLNARNGVSSEYRFSQFSYPGYGFSFMTHSGLLGFKRIWSKKVTSDVSAGPQWTGSSEGTGIPSSIGTAVVAAVNYEFHFDSAGLSFSRGTNGGSGYLFGSESDNVGANVSRRVGRDLNIGIEGSYQRTAGLENSGITSARYGGAQVNWRIGRYLGVFASYTAMDQSSSSALPASALGQLMHVVGFGIEYSPRETHLKH
jgi:hypothetical protein